MARRARGLSAVAWALVAMTASGCGLVIGLGDFKDAPSGTGTTGAGGNASGGGGATSSDTTTSTSSAGGAGGSACESGTKRDCYTGPEGTEGKGICKPGSQTCQPDGTWGACSGDVTPGVEDCATPEDDNCNGSANEASAGCVCVPDAATECYTGPPGTEGIGVCSSGLATCDATGKSFGTCAGEVTPFAESCADPSDENCDGYDCALWSELLQGTSDSPRGVAVDSLGNTYVVGSFEGAISFPGNTLVDAGSGDAFLTKFDASGKHTWSKQFGDAAAQEAFCVASDSTGAALIGGYSADTFQVAGQSVGPGAFVVKLDSSGSLAWSKTLGGKCQDDAGQVASIAITTQDDVVITGSFCSSVDFGNGPIASTGSTDTFVAKLRGSDGSCAPAQGYWGKVLGDANAQYGRRIAVDPAGNILVAGDFNGTMNFGTGALTSAGATDVYLAKLTSSGAASWAQRFGDPDAQVVGGLSVDNLGGPVLTGTMQGSVNFGGGPLVALYNVPTGFIARFNSSGLYKWSMQIGGYSSIDDLGSDGTGNLVLTGTFKGDVDFGSGPLSSNGINSDVFAVKLASDNSVVWAKRFGDAASQFAAGIAVASSGESTIVGKTEGQVDFGTGALGPPADLFDGFVARFAP